MKALFEKVTVDEQTSLLVRRFQMPFFDAPWHYHPEYELTYIVKGYGRRFVGDHSETFSAGDLVLIGSNLPHFWRSDDDFYQKESSMQVESIVVQFPAVFDQQLLAAIPEAQSIRQLLQRARYGLSFCPAIREIAANQLEPLATLNGLPQLLRLLAVLHQLAADSNATLLASDGYQLAPGVAETERMKRIFDYLLVHFREEIRVDQIASIAGMAPAAFCRYFKKRTRKSFIEYLNELRINHARKMLVNRNFNVGQVGLECGFNNSSHFHRQFKLYTGMTPLRYQMIMS
jgi:AraC-like DNA-binding protein